jgi:23S rRNA pseudouridine1911/1915/1917 synthase
MIVRETIPAPLAGDRLDKLVAFIADVSRTEAQRLVDAGAVQVDDQPAKTASQRIKLDQVVQVEVPEPVDLTVEADPSIEFTVIYADADIIVVDKPEGLVVHPGTGNDTGTLVHGLLARFPDIEGVGQVGRPGIVHRLDKGTSGLMVVARNQEAYESLVDQLSDHSVERVYLAIVVGNPETLSGVIDAPLGRSRRDPTRMTVQVDGKPSRTHYRVEQTFTHPEATALVRCELETGRTHQIRVHLSAIKHPVVGDPVYGKGRSKLEVSRPMLHATTLSLEHPGTGEHMTWTVPIPSDMVALLDTLSTGALTDDDLLDTDSRGAASVVGLGQVEVGAVDLDEIDTGVDAPIDYATLELESNRIQHEDDE